MNDAEFEFYLEEVCKHSGLTRESRKRKVQRFQDGTKHKGTAQDWNRPDYDLLLQAQAEGDDCWNYLAKYVAETQDSHTDWKIIFSLMAVLEQLIERRIAAQSAGQSSYSGKVVAEPVTVADGAPVLSSMEVCGDED